MLLKDSQPLLHQLVVVGNVPCGSPERVDAGFFSKIDPDFRNKDPFQVQASYFQGKLLNTLQQGRKNTGAFSMFHKSDAMPGSLISQDIGVLSKINTIFSAFICLELHKSLIFIAISHRT